MGMPLSVLATPCTWFRCLRGFLAYAGKVGLMKPIDDKDTYMDEIVGGVVALLGFGEQLSRKPDTLLDENTVPVVLCTETPSPLFPLFCAGFQLRAGWGLPFPFNILFLPFRIFEGFLAYYVAK